MKNIQRYIQRVSLKLFNKFSRQKKLIIASGLFDSNWYLCQYPEVNEYKNDPLSHFLIKGVFENKSPHPLFHLGWYRSFYRLDIKTNPLIHFIRSSNTQYNNPNPFFDLLWYAENYMRELTPNAIEILKHYYKKGEVKDNQPSENFDPQFYRNTYPETSQYIHGLLAHYIWKGRVQKKLPFDLKGKKSHSLAISLHQVDLCRIELNHILFQYFNTEEKVKEFFASCERFPEDVPLFFLPDNYASYNADLKIFENKPLEAIRHFLIHGYEENRFYKDFYIEQYTSNFYKTQNASRNTLLKYKPSIRTCVLVHIFYADIYEELKSYIKNLSGFDYDIYFNLVENNWSLDLHKLIYSDFPGAKITVSQNIGRDIGGLLNLLSYIKDIQSYDAYLLIHSKKSPHVPEVLGTKWRKDLLESTIGSREIVLQNLYLMERTDAGLIGTGLWRHKSVDKNHEKYQYVLKMLEISEKNSYCDYLSGTMMWLNCKVLNYLYSKCKDVVFENGNGKPLEFHMDGQLAHAIERSFGNICKQLSLKMIFR